MSSQSRGDFRTYRVSTGRRAGTINWLLKGLELGGCRIITPPAPGIAPFKVVFETPTGERMGAVFYLFTITSVVTKNRPADEGRFQLKYGSKDGKLHDLWQDPTGLYTTVFLGIDPSNGCWVAADPVLHSPTLMFISLEFKRHQLQAAKDLGWHVWERESTIRRNQRPDAVVGIEALVGGRPERLLDLVRFERAAKGLDQGNRQLLAEKFTDIVEGAAVPRRKGMSEASVSYAKLHQLAEEFSMGQDEILDLIAATPRLKMAVRGWVAEDHLTRQLSRVPGVTNCRRLNEEGKPDITLRYKGSPPLYIECKNVLRQTTAEGLARVDFQRTRASKRDHCTRYYRTDEFDVIAACLHAVTERWEFKFRIPTQLALHPKCPGRLSNLVRVDTAWSGAERALTQAAALST